MKSIHQLRKAGNKVCVNHERRYFDVINNRYVYLTNYEYSLLSDDSFVIGPYATGGYTTITITTTDNQDLIGQSECSKYDNYNKKLGVYYALKRIFGGCGGGCSGCACQH